MHIHLLFRPLLALAAIGSGPVLPVWAADPAAADAALIIHAAELAPGRIPRNLTGKFCEHLGANIYNGMDAQVLRNPTFADYPVATGQTTPDGVATFHFEADKLEGELRRQALRCGWPEAGLADLFSARRAGLASFWGRAGPRDTVQVSPDTGPGGGRAQRLEFKPGGGIKQWTWLPLHRTRKYEFELLARSPALTRLKLALLAQDLAAPAAVAAIPGLAGEWRKLAGSLALPDDAPADVPWCVVLSSESTGQLVIGHFFLRPADHVKGADPDVVRLLRQARLPLLRWPGGNFVSAYHWEDGVGPVEQRPTRPNYAWGGVEPNTFGTDEFVAFCRAVGCEPMICVNAGTGTPTEAARWLEYCNGPATSPLGARRAANGHPEPYRVRHWEVGNELWGRWQAHWTTASGYVDRYAQFAQALLKADPAIALYACGAPVLWGKNWNDQLIAGAAAQLRSLTDHPLIGGDVPRTTEPLDVYRDFMRVPDILERKWSALRDDMERGGVPSPRLAITELQLFAHLGAPADGPGSERLNRENLVSPGTQAEALYDTLIYHAAARLQPFVELMTHSATVNHGGGLRKERERVYANPCYYANLLFADFAEATLVKTELQAPAERAPIVLPDLKNAGGDVSFGAIAGLAARTTDGGLLLSLVHRGTAGPVRLKVNLEGFSASGQAQLRTLAAPVPWAANALEQPAAVQPVAAEAAVRDGSLVLVLAPFSIVQARFAPAPEAKARF